MYLNGLKSLIRYHIAFLLIMNSETTVKINLRFEGGTADEHKLDLYDAGKSIKGFSKALHIICTSLLNDGEIRYKYTETKGIKFYLVSARQGSFLETVSIVLDNDIVKNIGLTVIGTAIHDMIKYTLKGSVGQTFKPETRIVNEIANENPDFLEEISQALETPMREIQTPIRSNKNVVIKIEKPRGELIAKLDNETLDYVLNDPSPQFETNIIGNVTRFNALTLNGGRFYSDIENRIVSFTYEKGLDSIQKGLLSTSLDRYTNGLSCKIAIDAYVVKNKLGKVKKYKVEKVERRY